MKEQKKVCLLSPDEKFSLPLMKLGRYHKQKNDVFSCDYPDIVYISSILEKSKEKVNTIVQNIRSNAEIHIGGSTWIKPDAFIDYPNLVKYYSVNLPQEIDKTVGFSYSTKEQRHPSPNLSEKYNKRELKEYSKQENESKQDFLKRIDSKEYQCFGYTTRGCDKNHSYCIVPLKEGKLSKEKPLDMFCNRDNIILDLNEHLNYLNKLMSQCNSIKKSCDTGDKKHCKAYKFMNCIENTEIKKGYEQILFKISDINNPIKARILDNNFIGTSKTKEWFLRNTKHALDKNIFLDADAMDKDYLNDEIMTRISELYRKKLMTSLRFAYDNPTEHEREKVIETIRLAKKYKIQLDDISFYMYIHNNDIDNILNRLDTVYSNGSVAYVTHPESKLGKLLSEYINGRQVRRADMSRIKEGFIGYLDTKVPVKKLFKDHNTSSFNEISKYI